MMNEPVSSIMSTQLITASPADSLAEIHQILSTHRIHHVPIVDDSKLVGLLTTYDLFKLGKAKENYGNIPVKDVMTTKLATLSPTDKVGTAAEIFLEHLFHALPITNEGGEILGIVTTLDVLKYNFKKEYPNPIL